jgi:hypothetical protein
MMGSARVVISFDIDGTLETGDPPGPIEVSFVRRAQVHGCLIGSCSDRTVLEQSNMWAGIDITPDFAVVKNRLLSVRERFESDRFIHIGDTHVDAHYAEGAGFEFIFAVDLAHRLASDCGTCKGTGSAPPAMTDPVL